VHESACASPFVIAQRIVVTDEATGGVTRGGFTRIFLILHQTFRNTR
jgi:hypothetical protein